MSKNWQEWCLMRAAEDRERWGWMYCCNVICCATTTVQDKELKWDEMLWIYYGIPDHCRFTLAYRTCPSEASRELIIKNSVKACDIPYTNLEGDLQGNSWNKYVSLMNASLEMLTIFKRKRYLIILIYKAIYTVCRIAWQSIETSVTCVVKIHKFEIYSYQSRTHLPLLMSHTLTKTMTHKCRCHLIKTVQVLLHLGMKRYKMIRNDNVVPGVPKYQMQ